MYKCVNRSTVFFFFFFIKATFQQRNILAFQQRNILAFHRLSYPVFRICIRLLWFSLLNWNILWQQYHIIEYQCILLIARKKGHARLESVHCLYEALIGTCAMNHWMSDKISCYNQCHNVRTREIETYLLVDPCCENCWWVLLVWITGLSAKVSCYRQWYNENLRDWNLFSC